MATSVNASILQEEKLLAALPTALPNATVIVGNVRKTTADLVADYQEHLDVEAEIVAVRAQLRNLTVKARGLRKTTRADTLALRGYATATLGENSTDFATLGFEPRKVGKPSVATVADAVVKRRATRVARHTQGPRQKAAIHGAPPAMTEPPPAPAPAAPASTDSRARASPK
jgi:hypothetical protein